MNQDEKKNMMEKVFNMSPDQPNPNQTQNTKEKKTRKREYTAEQMEALKERLKLARAKSAENRAQKKTLKNNLISQVKETVDQIPNEKINNIVQQNKNFENTEHLTNNLLMQIEKIMDGKISTLKQETIKNKIHEQHTPIQQLKPVQQVQEVKQLKPHIAGQKRQWRELDEFNL